ncbi:hypothetical protein Ancab_039725 [Ancistrocladus abbreviatus]
MSKHEYKIRRISTAKPHTKKTNRQQHQYNTHQEHNSYQTHSQQTRPPLGKTKNNQTKTQWKQDPRTSKQKKKTERDATELLRRVFFPLVFIVFAFLIKFCMVRCGWLLLSSGAVFSCFHSVIPLF